MPSGLQKNRMYHEGIWNSGEGKRIVQRQGEAYMRFAVNKIELIWISKGDEVR